MKQLLSGAFLCIAALSTSANAQEARNQIGPQDRLSIKVLEWLPAKGEYKEWTAVGGEYAVEPGATINMPFAGEISVAGQSTADLSRVIAESLRKNLSLPLRPDVGVEIVGRSPIYIIGGVEQPGKVDFTPGLTAIEAVALAGGFYRGGNGTLRLEREIITAEADLDVARDSAARLVARIDRLETELADGTVIELDAKQPLADRAKAFLPEEQRLLEIRKQARESQLESLRSRRSLSLEQLKSLDEKSINLDRQVKLAREQLDGVESLVGRGLTVASRRFELERTLSDLEGRVLDLQNARLAAQLEANEAERLGADVVTQFKTQAANELQSARAELSKAEIGIAQGEQLIRESSVIAPEKLIDRAGNFRVGIRFFRTTTIAGAPTTTEIDKDTVLQGGDTLQVQMDPAVETVRTGSSGPSD
ncbi:hypothetical protein ASG43_07090 [Aureimonas sp. Leaf454]|uniref:polysaccharide biosynthesis/export family protein n=1 Tax=Aureimonas sp. Leaf454 TaxID=1736381 RepID=UPI0006FFC7C9|nr:polysaccharide biosynthesis/export family protein [Aureimonas sp. Leaf454]KQT51001.1 hypothetical protein ASG43_07090 [Aureimonas sp. Leaf454]